MYNIEEIYFTVSIALVRRGGSLIFNTHGHYSLLFNRKDVTYFRIRNQGIHTYIPLTLYPLSGSRGVADIPPRHPCFTKIS
jgi:hypothetical protein